MRAAGGWAEGGALRALTRPCAARPAAGTSPRLGVRPARTCVRRAAPPRPARPLQALPPREEWFLPASQPYSAAPPPASAQLSGCRGGCCVPGELRCTAREAPLAPHRTRGDRRAPCPCLTGNGGAARDGRSRLLPAAAAVEPPPPACPRPRCSPPSPGKGRGAAAYRDSAPPPAREEEKEGGGAEGRPKGLGAGRGAPAPRCAAAGSPLGAGGLGLGRPGRAARHPRVPAGHPERRERAGASHLEAFGFFARSSRAASFISSVWLGRFRAREG